MITAAPPLFEIRKTDSSSRARTGILRLAHGDVHTPVFMPVGTNATVKALTSESLLEIGFEILLSNTYHVFLRPGTEVITGAGSLHNFMRWDKNILTDSGGFQIFSLAALRKITEEGVRFRSHLDGSAHFFTPEMVVDIQRIYNSDIQMQLDVCSEYETSYKKALGAFLITEQWMRRAKARFNLARDEGYKGIFFPIVQGNFYRDLRERSAESVCNINSEGIAIGGLSVGEPFELFAEYLAFTARLLPREKPLYVMGIGTPFYILTAIEQGVDMFDCVLPTRLARHGAAMTRNGQLALKKEVFKNDFGPLEEGCACKVCRQHSRAYIHHLYKTKEILSAILLSYHNLYFLNNMVREARNAIEADRFLEFKRDFIRHG